MSSDTVISIKNLSKIYRIFEHPKDRLKQSIWRGKKKYYKEFHALSNIFFDIKKGTTIGIIGKNGSGKSTLLQILSKTLSPTLGEVDVKGRVAALLELGSGFNPEFTGRENVIMNCTIMGLSSKEINERMSEIEDFAEIGDFIDQPVKTYSSGMFVRLAFACAVNVDPDILIVDEALAVGDMNFQLKCIDKMKTFKQAGKTILFVSHDTHSIRNFCDEVIWMMDGQIHQRGGVYVVTEEYEDYMKMGLENNKGTEVLIEIRKNILTIDKVTFQDSIGEQKDSFQYGEPIKAVVNYTLNSHLEGIIGGIAIYDKQNTYICGVNTKLDSHSLPSRPGQYQLALSYPEMNLLPGTYFVDVGFFESSAIVGLDYRSRMASFRINSGEYFAEGIICLKHQWICER